jgi:hypothetical protein
MAGYYDDFMGARAVPDESNTPGLLWHSSKTHQGNPINGWAPLNPRYAYAWVERGDGASAQFNNAGITTDTRKAFNSGVDKWLGIDMNRRSTVGAYEGLVQLQYPDSLTNANRQKFDGGTGILGGATKAYQTTVSNSNYAAVEAYMLFCNGYNTNGRYFAAIGTNDSTFGRSAQQVPDQNTGGALASDAGLPLAAARTPAKVVRTHLTGVFSGEAPNCDDLDGSSSSWGAGQPRAWLYPITSPAGKPFLSIDAYTTSTSFDPILSYDGSLNSKGDGDIFTIRMYAAKHQGGPTLRLRIGCEGTAFTSVVGGDTGYTRAAIDYEITPDGLVYGGFAGLGNWNDANNNMNQRWDDYDFILNYTAGTYDVIKNGTSVATGVSIGTKADGSRFTAADMYGWELDVKSNGTHGKTYVLIDRVGMIRPLNDYPLSTTEMPPVLDFAYNSTINSTSKLNLKIADDDADLKLLSYFDKSNYSDSTILMFRDNIDRPIWRGTTTSLTYNRKSDRQFIINLQAIDYFEDMDRAIPTWELGSSGTGDSTTQVAYNRADSQNNLNVFYFGAETLSLANASLGYNEGEDGDGVWKTRLDSRMRRASAHPIQLYNSEDTIGPNNAYADWDTHIGGTSGNTDAQYRVLHSRWVKDLPKSPWFSHMFGKIKNNALLTGTTTSAITVGSTTSLTANMPPFNTGTGNVSFEIVDADNFVDHGVATAITPTNTTNPFRMVLCQEEPTYLDAVFGADFFGFVILQFPTALFNFHRQYIRISGITDSASGGLTGNESRLNGVWQLKKFGWPFHKQTSGGTQYTNYVLCDPNNNFDRKRFTVNFTSTPTSSAGGYVTKNIGNPFGFKNNFSAREIAPIMLPTSNIDVGYGGCTLTLPTTNFLQRDHSTGATITLRDIDDDYKHIWVLWADMRNDGNANADAMKRDKKFGLMLPHSANYNLSLGISETDISATQERTNFVDLNLGEDIDLWEMDATADPITGNPWSAISGGSNTESNSKYHNWEDKAGAFVIIDASKFFNLNTTSNGGKTGQSSAGRKEIGDFLTETEGFPVLVDNYWQRAICAYNNANEDTASAGAGSPFLWSANYKYLLNNSTSLATDIQVGDTIIQLNDSNLPSNVALPAGIPDLTAKTGRLMSDAVVIALTSEEKKKIYHAVTQGALATITQDGVYGGSGSNPGVHIQPGSYLDGSTSARPDAQLDDDTFVIDCRPGFTSIGIGSDPRPDMGALRVGHKITLSNSTGTTTNVDGDYVIEDIIPEAAYSSGGSTNVNGPWLVLRQNNVPSGTITAGYAHLHFPGTYFMRGLFDLGVPVLGTKVTGEWNGAGYGSESNVYFDKGVSSNTSGTSGTGTGYIGIADASSFSDSGTVIVGNPNFQFSGPAAQAAFTYTGKNTTTTPHRLTGITYLGGGSSIISGTPIPVYEIRNYENNAEYLAILNSLIQSPRTGFAVTTTTKEDANALNASTTSSGYTDLVVRSGLANIFPMRLIMSLTGFVESKGTATWYDSDKIRAAYSDCLNKNWLSQSSVKGMPDINTVPITKDMVTTFEPYIEATSGVPFSGQAGLITNIAAPSSGHSVITCSNPHALSDGDTITILSSQPLGLLTSQQNYVVSDTTSTTFKIPRTAALSAGSVLGRWRKANRVEQYGSVNDCRNETYATIFQSTQEKSGIGDDYDTRKVFTWMVGRDGKPSLRPNYSSGYTFNTTNLRVSDLQTSNKEHITNVRVFYAGNGSYVDYPSAQLGSSPRWQIEDRPEISTKAEAFAFAKTEYEKYKTPPMKISAKILRIDEQNTILGSNDNMISGARYGYVADQSRAIPYGYSTSATSANYTWNSLWGGNLFPGMVSALDGRDGDCTRPTGAVAYNNNYWWYGSNSLSYAVQIVHIPRNMPKTTQKTPGGGKINADGRLRMVIDIVDSLGADIGYDELEFQLSLHDYDWTDNEFAATSRSVSRIQFDANGYYEIDIPSTYWATGRDGTERIVVSINYEYLKALVRERCPSTNYTRNGNSYAGKTHSTLNAGSIFPLGMRKINSNVQYWGERAEWYAPRLEITDDINFLPATNISYTDSALELSNEVLGIKSIGWSVSQGTETVSFTLERDISRSAKGLTSFFGTGGGNDAGPWKPLPPPTGGTPGGFPVGPGAGDAGFPAQGGFGFVGGFGAITAGTTQGSEFDPTTLAGTGNRPNGTGINDNSATILNANNVGRGLNNQIKGVMDFNTDSSTGGSFSVLGQKKPSQPPINSTGVEGVDSFITPVAGDAVMSDNGMSFAGATDATTSYTAFSVTSRIPNDVVNDVVRVTGRYTMEADDGVAEVTVKAECVETGAYIEQDMILNPATNGFITLFSGSLGGLDTPNNTIKITIGREAGLNNDTAQFSSLIIHNVQVASDRRSVTGSPEAQSYSFGA